MFQQAIVKYFLMFLKITLATALLVFVAVQTYAAMSRDTTPSQPYRIVEQIGDLQIRYYPRPSLPPCINPAPTAIG